MEQNQIKQNQKGRRRKRTKGHVRRQDRELFLMSVPAIVWYILFCYLPLFGIFFAFKTFTPRPGESLFKNLFINSPWAGLDNFSFRAQFLRPAEVFRASGDSVQHPVLQYRVPDP